MIKEDYEEVLKDLERIAYNPYIPDDSERNHQTFARSLYHIMELLKNNKKT